MSLEVGYRRTFVAARLYSFAVVAKEVIRRTVQKLITYPAFIVFGFAFASVESIRSVGALCCTHAVSCDMQRGQKVWRSKGMCTSTDR